MGRIVGLVFPVPTEAGEPPVQAAEEYTCPVCGKGYKSQASLDKHIASKHPEAEASED